MSGPVAAEIPTLTQRDIDRFHSYYEIDHETGCWNWKLALNTLGYGTFVIIKKKYKAHRISLAVIGLNVSSDLVVDHLCRNPRCCNPHHLELVTNHENLLRGINNVCAANTKKTHCNRGHILVPIPNPGRLKRKCKECDQIRSYEKYWKNRERENLRGRIAHHKRKQAKLEAAAQWK